MESVMLIDAPATDICPTAPMVLSLSESYGWKLCAEMTEKHGQMNKFQELVSVLHIFFR